MAENSSTISVTINNKQLDCEAGLDLFSLLKDQNLAQKKGIAVAVNDNVISKANWADTNVKMNDSILIITATQGG